MEPWGTHLLAFLAGAMMGAAGTYLADKFTDRRREGEASKSATALLRSTEVEMPELFAEFRSDRVEPGFSGIRDFFVLPNRGVTMNAEGEILTYYEAEHQNLSDKLATLEERGYIRDITTGNTPKYRMSDEFMAYLRK